MLNIPQTSLDFFGQERPYKEAQEFYQHEDDWSNRLILGDSLQIMTSLIEKEAMFGQVQMIYYDPPYGINYSSNFQSAFKSSPGKKIEYRPEAITAFRDTWDYGNHSYLTVIRKQLMVAHELLVDTGSIFLQISKANVHRVRLLLDEIFGSENFMWDILFQTKPGAGSKFPSTCDYILWYAKNKELFWKSDKLHQLYLDRDKNDSKQMKRYNKIHLQNGAIIPLPKNSIIPKGGKLCEVTSLFSQNTTENDRTKPHTFPNKKLFTPPPNAHWALGHDALDKLYEKNRLCLTGNNTARILITYPEDYPIKLNNIWTGMGITGEKIYDVQTKTTVIERCMLMCSDPGDLILDITCGSGVTPYVAEQHGRRWMACDVSKLSIAMATGRLQTAVYNWYKLKNELRGICGGLEYEEFVKLTAGTLSDPDSQEIEYRYEKPIVEKKRFRISGPFTVEQIPSPVIISNEEQLDESTRKLDDDVEKAWVNALKISGVSTNKGKIKFKSLDKIDENNTIHYIGTANDDKTYAISLGSNHSPLGHIQVENAIRERRPHGTDGLIFISSIFGPEAKDLVFNTREKDNILGAEANSDLLIPDLKQKESDTSFVQIGRPRMKIKKQNGKYTVIIEGYDYFNVEDGTLTAENTEKIAIWMLDTNYDGRTMNPSQIFFPNTDHIEDFAKKLQRSLRDGELNTNLLDKFTGTKSIPFKLGDRKTIAIKTIDMEGRETKYSKTIGDDN